MRTLFIRPVTLLAILLCAAGCVAPPPVQAPPPAAAPTVAPTAVQPAAAEANPYRPENLFKLASDLKKATEDCKPTEGTEYLVMTNAPGGGFWNAARQGASRASEEIGVPITFHAQGYNGGADQLDVLTKFVDRNYSALTFSSLDPEMPKPLIEKAMSQGIPVLVMDSDVPGSKRALYVGMSDYDAGKAAGETAKELMGTGKVVGLVGLTSAQNARDRIAGLKDALEGSDLEMVEVLSDGYDSYTAGRNARSAIEKYPDLAGFIGFYSYDGPAACQVVRDVGKIGQLKIVAFDTELQTQACTEDGVVQAMIGQRVFFYGYLSSLVMHAMVCNGVEETMKLLDPYLKPWPSVATEAVAEGADGKVHLDTGVDVIRAETLDQYIKYLDEIGVRSQ
jgi:ribose transport system substrate-binding protein